MDEKSLEILEYPKIISLLAENTVSKMGYERAKALKPFTKPYLVKQALNETDEAVKLVQRQGIPDFGGLKDIRPHLKKVSIGGCLLAGELLDVADVLRAVRKIRRLLEEKDFREHYPGIDQLVSGLIPLKPVEDRINRCIASDGEVSDAASPKLLGIRRETRNLNDEIRQKLNSIIHSTACKKYLQESIVTMRENRYVVPVKQEFKGSFPGIVHDQSSSGATLFIEPIEVVNLNNELKRLKLKEKEETERILRELTAMVSGAFREITSNLEILGELDFIFAKAQLSIDMDASSPLINDKTRLKIRAARHPLLKGDVVPVDLELGGEFTTLVITGPNTGGKTVTLKTTGLLCLMAQSGLHIPARWGSELPVFTNVFADIGDEQSIEQSLSTFSSHMTNIVRVLNSAGLQDLVLLDELGAGTDPDEGAALAAAVLETLRRQGILTIATTHYSELKAYAYTTPGVENASVEFDTETLRPTYRLLTGLPGKSNAFEISSRLGLNDNIIKLAREYLNKESIKVEDLLTRLHDDTRAAMSDREKAEELKREIEELKKEYDEQIKRLELRKERVIRKAREEAEAIVKNAKTEVESVIAEIDSMYSELKTTEHNRRVERARQSLRDVYASVSEYFHRPIIMDAGGEPGKITCGTRVEIPSIGQKGVVLETPKAGEAVVQVGAMRITLPIKTLKKLNSETERKTVKNSTPKFAAEKLRNISPQLDIRGYRLNDALQLIDKYLDDAYLAGLSQVALIHGKGTGALREGVRKHLGDTGPVESFRAGEIDEGGDGVTIVKLKL